MQNAFLDKFASFLDLNESANKVTDSLVITIIIIHHQHHHQHHQGHAHHHQGHHYCHQGHQGQAHHHQGHHDHDQDSLITKVPHTAIALSRAIELVDLLDIEPGTHSIILKHSLFNLLDIEHRTAFNNLKTLFF